MNNACIGLSTCCRFRLRSALSLCASSLLYFTQSASFRQTLTGLRKDVDALVIAILKHLPDTVVAFDRLGPTSATRGGSSSRSLGNAADLVGSSGMGVTLVQEMLEPELAGRRAANVAGPLAQARMANANTRAG